VTGTLAVDGWAVTFGTARKGLGGLAQSPPRCTKCNSPPINGQCTNFILFDVANITLKGKQQQSTRNQTIQYRTHEIHEEQLQCQEQVEKLIYKFFYSNGNRQVQCVSDTCPTWDQVISRSRAPSSCKQSTRRDHDVRRTSKLSRVESTFLYFIGLYQLNESIQHYVEKLLNSRGSSMAPPASMHEASKSIFGLVWPWPLTPKSWPIHALATRTTWANLRQIGWFVFTSLVTDKRTNGEVEKCIPPPSSRVRRRHKNHCEH